MNSKLRAYLDLVRLPNLFTAAADIFAGFFFAGGGFEDWAVLLRLSLASMCLYAGGVVLNDVCDLRADAADRPSRPIASGRIAFGDALRLSIILLIAGASLAASVSLRGGAIAALLVIAIVLYDAVLKRTFLAPAVMGACRGLNIAMGIFGTARLPLVAALPPIAVVWLYITSLTFFARTEARVSGRRRLVLGTLGQCVAICGLWTIGWWGEPAGYSGYAWLAVGLAAWIAYNGGRAVRDPVPLIVQAAVGRFVMSLIILDACLAWSIAGPAAGAVTLALLIPTAACSRTLRVT